MSANLTFLLGLVMIAIALIAFVVLVLIPDKGDKDVLFRGWLVTDQDGERYVCTKHPRRYTWEDKDGNAHGIWWHDDANFYELGKVFPAEDLTRVQNLPTWDDEPVRVELVLSHFIDYNPPLDEIEEL